MRGLKNFYCGLKARYICWRAKRLWRKFVARFPWDRWLVDHTDAQRGDILADLYVIAICMILGPGEYSTGAPMSEYRDLVVSALNEYVD